MTHVRDMPNITSVWTTASQNIDLGKTFQTPKLSLIAFGYEEKKYLKRIGSFLFIVSFNLSLQTAAVR